MLFKEYLNNDEENYQQNNFSVETKLDTIKSHKIEQIRKIINLIKESLIQNKSNQINLHNLKDELSKKQTLIERLIDKIKKINKSKQKKHTKYLSYMSEIYSKRFLCSFNNLLL